MVLRNTPNAVGGSFDSDLHRWSRRLCVQRREYPQRSWGIVQIQPTLGRRGAPEYPQRKSNDTFEFLGFTHYWARSRKGTWVVKRKTAGKRLRRAGKRIWEWCRRNRHDSIFEQHWKIGLKLRGHYQYYGIRGNYASVKAYYEYVKRAWRQWLGRRGGKKKMTVARFLELLEDLPLPRPRIVHRI